MHKVDTPRASPADTELRSMTRRNHWGRIRLYMANMIKPRIKLAIVHAALKWQIPRKFASILIRILGLKKA